MAIMIPDYMHRDCRSAAERKLFERFRMELSDNYTVLHSLGLAKHKYKLKAEIDFAVVCRRGILCIEVKGGRIRQERGVWYFTNRYEEVIAKRESPFDQASSGMYALKRGIEKRFGWKSPQCEAVIGYAVFFPDQSFTLESPEWDMNRLVDINKINEPLEKLIEFQFDYSEQEIRRVSSRQGFDLMSESQYTLLVKYLRPDFECIRSLSAEIAESHENLLRLTEEQFYVLDQLGANDRVMICGGAGTGKTVLAVEKARREFQKGSRVLFICYNRLLARHIRQIFGESSSDNKFEAHTLHGYARKIIGKAGMDDLLPAEEDETLFTKKYPEVFEQAFVELFDAPPFDVLIVDEGQDIKNGIYLGMLDWLVQGGLHKGKWIWFEDSYQDIFRSIQGTEDIPDLKQYHPALCRLSMNCRNTRPISIFNSLATATDKQKCLVDSELKVEPVFFRSSSHQLKLLENIIKKILSGGVKASDIIILTPFTVTKSILRGLNKVAGVSLRQYDETGEMSLQSLRYTTIHKFKGLESKVVVITDICELKKPEARSLNYVAFSRAIACLEILIHEDARKQYEELAYEFGLRD